MEKPVIITALLLLSAVIVKAQDSLKTHHPQPDSIIKVVPFGDGRHTSELYTIGGQIVPPEDVKARILAYAPSAGEYHQAKTNIVWATVSTVGFGLAAGATVLEFIRDSKTANATPTIINGQATFTYQQHSHTAAYVFTGIASAFLVSSIINYIHSARHARKSLYLYNQQYQ